VALWGADGVCAVACGSFRRGKADCGDVDVLLTHPSKPAERLDINRLLEYLSREEPEHAGEGPFILRKLKSPVVTPEESAAEAAKRRDDGLAPHSESSGDWSDDEGVDGDGDCDGDDGAEGGSRAGDAAGRGAAAAASSSSTNRRYASPLTGHDAPGASRVLDIVARSHADTPGVKYDANALDTRPELLPHPSTFYANLKMSVMTVCRLSPSSRVRRLDIKSYPRAVFPFALLYFTGSDYFNRSLRLYVKQSGWSLSDHGLSRASHEMEPLAAATKPRATPVYAEKVWEGHSIAVACEADVLRAIGVPWRAPCDRGL
jgi:hypothetical protein